MGVIFGGNPGKFRKIFRVGCLRAKNFPAKNVTLQNIFGNGGRTGNFSGTIRFQQKILCIVGLRPELIFYQKILPTFPIPGTIKFR